MNSITPQICNFKGTLLPQGQVVNDVKKVAKKFINEAGEEVQDVILKGKATLPDGSAFSGVFEAVNKNGDKVTIKYKDGFKQESYINGALYKIYEQLKSIPLVVGKNPIVYSRSQGTRIKLVEDNAIVKMFMNLYDDKGRARRTITQGLDGVYDMLDIQSGRIAAKSKIKSLNLQSVIFDPNGNVAKSVTKQGSLGFIKENTAVNSAKEVGGKLSFDIVDTPAFDYAIAEPKIFRRYVNGEPIEEVTKDYRQARHILTSRQKHSDGSEDLLEIKLPKGKLSDNDNKYIFITLKRGDKVDCEAVIGEEGKNLSKNANTKTMKRLEKRVKSAISSAQDAKIDFDYNALLEILPKIHNF